MEVFNMKCGACGRSFFAKSKSAACPSCGEQVKYTAKAPKKEKPGTDGIIVIPPGESDLEKRDLEKFVGTARAT